VVRHSLKAYDFITQGVNTDIPDIPARSDMQEPLEDGYGPPAVGRYEY